MHQEGGSTASRSDTGWCSTTCVVKKAPSMRVLCRTGGLDFPVCLSAYEPCNIFHIDKTVLFFKALPDKAIAFKEGLCLGGKQSKE